MSRGDPWEGTDIRDLLEIQENPNAGLDKDVVQKRRRAVAATLPPDGDMLTRDLVAEELSDQDLPPVTAPEVRDPPEAPWTVAAHASNVGELPDAIQAIEALLRPQADTPRARSLKNETLVRQDRSAELLAELDKPVEDLA